MNVSLPFFTYCTVLNESLPVCFGVPCFVLSASFMLCCVWLWTGFIINTVINRHSMHSHYLELKHQEHLKDKFVFIHCPNVECYVCYKYNVKCYSILLNWPTQVTQVKLQYQNHMVVLYCVAWLGSVYHVVCVFKNNWILYCYYCLNDCIEWSRCWWTGFVNWWEPT